MNLKFPSNALPGKADRFAEAAHAAIGQLRKYTGEPYIVHPRAVAALVHTVTHDEVTLAAAFLHDTVEDTSVTLAQIAQELGADVALLVENLADVSRPEDGNRQLRKTIDRQHAAQADPRAKTIKLADLIDNTQSIVAHDPGFAQFYLAEKLLLLDVLSDGHPDLYRLAIKTLRKARSELAALPPL